MEARQQRVDEPVGIVVSVDRQGTALVYRKPLRKLRWGDMKVVLGGSLAGWNKHNAPRMGAALAFYTLLSLTPLLLVVISVAGLVYGARAAESGVIQQLQILFGEQRAKIVQALLEGSQNREVGLWAAALGTLILMFGASAAITELREDLNTIWDIAPPQLSAVQEIAKAVKDRLRSLIWVVAIVLLLTASLAFSAWFVALGGLASFLPAHGVVLHVLNAIFSFVAVTGLFGAVYKVAPQVPIEWSDVVLGATVTSLLFTLGNSLLGIYLGKATFASTYGAAASTVVLVVWVYYSSQAFFLGAEFTKAFAERYGSCPSHNQQNIVSASGVAATPPTSPLPIVLPVTTSLL